MSLQVGARFGSHEVVALLGTGGMGAVYRARDTKLNREVALKVLLPEVANDPERLARFRREAQVLASLNHPHIGAIYSLEEADGITALVLELVEGETLADKLLHASSRASHVPGLPIAESLEIARQIADGLDAAHKKGLIHRDLKPANVKVTSDGVVKVLDFGLAKAVAREDSRADLTQSPTMTVGGTRGGMVLGTAAYMSPEQARGKPVDPRTDIWAFGCVLYEMLTGRATFARDTIVDTLAAIIERDPEWKALPATTPPAIVRLLRRCLEKDPSRRPHDIAAVRMEIDAAPTSIPLPADRAASIAVLAFTDMSAAKDQDWFSDGVAEEIINALAQIDGLRVAARTSSFSFKGKSVAISEIGTRLNVRHVLEGSVRKAGNRVRITAQLVEASSGYQLWSERYDRQLEDIFDVQDEIARTIVARLKIALEAGQSERFVKVATTNMDAYQLYLKGRALLYKRGLWIVRAQENFREAVGLDPGYAQAWAGLADAHTSLGFYGFERSNETLPQAIEAAKRAVDLDPESAEAHSALACAALLWDHDVETAEHEFLRALTLNPTYTQARSWYGLFFLQSTVGRLDDGVEEVQRALNGDPLSGYATGVYSYALCMTRRFSEGVVQARLAVERDPESFIARWSLALACHWSGRFDEAIAAFETMLPASGRNVWAIATLAVTYADMGKPDEAKALHQELLARRAYQYVQPVMLAISASGVGDHEAALGFCRQAVDERDAQFWVLGRIYPDLDRVRADPRFADIVARFHPVMRPAKT